MAGRFEILEFLGEGGMGAVYKARDTVSNTVIALKLLKTAGLSEEETRRRLGVESRAALLLNHPNVVRTLEVGVSPDLPFIASEFVDGVTLDRRIGGGDLSRRQILGIGAGIAEGLAASHAAGLVHCDLKPSNIILDREGTPRILDFGISRHRATSGAVSTVTTTIALSDTSGQLVGTCHYLSPEQVAGRAVDWRADVFSLGVILYEMFAGRRPFQGQNPLAVAASVLTESPARPQGVDSAIWRAIARCLEKEPARRWQSAADLSRTLREFDTAARPARGWRIGAAAAVVTGILLAGLAGYGLRGIRHRARAPRIVPLTHGDGVITGARFAGDGTVVFSASWNGAPSEIQRLTLGDPTPQPTGERGEIVALQGSRVLVRENGSAVLTRGLLNEGRIPLGADVLSADLIPPGEPYTARVRHSGRDYVLEFPEGTPVYSAPAPISGLRISPDAAWVAFFEYRPATDSHQLVFANRRGERKALPEMWQFARGIAWHRNGREVVFGAANHAAYPALRSASMTGEIRELASLGADVTVEDIDAAGRILVQLSHNYAPVLLRDSTGQTANVNLFQLARRPSVSDDAAVAAFSEMLQGNTTATQASDPIYVWRAGRRTTHVAFANFPQISPDGAWLAALRLEPDGHFLQIYSLRSGKLEFWKTPWEPIGLTWLPDSGSVCLAGRGKQGVESILVKTDNSRQPLRAGVHPKWFAPGGRAAYGEQDGRLVRYDTNSWTATPSCEIGRFPHGPITADSRKLIGYRPLDRRPAGPARVEIITLDLADCTEQKVTEIQSRSHGETVGEVRATPDLRWAIYTAPRSTGNLFLIEGAL